VFNQEQVQVRKQSTPLSDLGDGILQNFLVRLVVQTVIVCNESTGLKESKVQTVLNGVGREVDAHILRKYLTWSLTFVALLLVPSLFLFSLLLLLNDESGQTPNLNPYAVVM